MNKKFEFDTEIKKVLDIDGLMLPANIWISK